ncbi:MAG: hypothetical protein ACI9G1_005854, partial [Pirellulaceae bacterium]
AKRERRFWERDSPGSWIAFAPALIEQSLRALP